MATVTCSFWVSCLGKAARAYVDMSSHSTVTYVVRKAGPASFAEIRKAIPPTPPGRRIILKI